MRLVASMLEHLSKRAANLAYLLDNPAYARVRQSGGARDLYRLLNKRWLRSQSIGTVIDVGANEGQFLKSALELLPAVSVLACEPLPDVASSLQQTFGDRKSFHLETIACGSANAVSTIHSSKFAPSSSLLAVTPEHIRHFPNTEVIDHLQIRVQPLDDVVAKYPDLPRPFLLKIDVQGYEKQVLLGARKTLSECSVVICELNAINLYEDQAPIDEVLIELRNSGFELADVGGMIHSPQDDRLIYMDAAFVRRVN